MVSPSGKEGGKEQGHRRTHQLNVNTTYRLDEVTTRVSYDSIEGPDIPSNTPSEDVYDEVNITDDGSNDCHLTNPDEEHISVPGYIEMI